MMNLKKKQTLRGQRGKAFWAFLLLIFLSIPLMIEARIIRRKMHMVCLESQYAFYNVDLGRGECCNSEPRQDEYGNYYCPDVECSKNEDCPDNSICVLPMRQCLTCIDGYTAYCAQIGEVTIGDASWKGCIEAACMAGSCEQVWYEHDLTRGYCCADGAAAYCIDVGQEENCERFGCCDGEAFKSFDRMKVNSCCSASKVVKDTGVGKACCAEEETAYCLSMRDGICSSMSCCNGTPYANAYASGVYNCCPNPNNVYCHTYNIDGSCKMEVCCTGTLYQRTPTKSDCCGSFQNVINDVIGAEGSGLQACCSAGQVGYCQEYDDDGSCLRTGCCSGTPYNLNNPDISPLCCASSQQVLDEVVGAPDGLQACCNSNETAYYHPSYQEAACCAGTPYKRSPTTYACCSSPRIVSDYFDEVQGCCQSGYTPYCSKYEDEKCVEVSCEGGECVPFRLNKKQGKCCDTSKYDLRSVGEYFVCQDSSEITCPEGEVSYLPSYSISGYSCCDIEGDYTLYSLTDDISACCPDGYKGYCSVFDGNGVCRMSACHSDDCVIYQRTLYDAGCCSSNVVGNFDGLSACCSDGYKGYCRRYDKNGKCVETSCCYHRQEQPYCAGYNENGTCSYADCCSGTVYRAKEDVSIQYCCAGTNVVSKSFDGLKICCPANQPAYCYSYDTSGHCTNVRCCNGTVWTTPEGRDSCCTGSLEEFEGMSVCCSSGQKTYCAGYNEDGTCFLARCYDDTCSPYRDSLTNGACCPSSKVVLNGPDGLSACCTAGQKVYCSNFDETGRCTKVYCCSGNPYMSGISKESCCSSNNIVSDFFDDVQGCCNPGDTPFCSSYDTNGKCISVSCCNAYLYQRKKGVQGCCQFEPQPVGDGIEVCTSSSRIPYCYKYDNNGICLEGTTCPSNQSPYRSSQTSATCCSDTMTESFDGIQACVKPGYTRAYCSNYVNGKCNKVSVSYISGGCIPYRISATKGGCCSGTVVKNGDYEACV